MAPAARVAALDAEQAPPPAAATGAEEIPFSPAEIARISVQRDPLPLDHDGVILDEAVSANAERRHLVGFEAGSAAIAGENVSHCYGSGMISRGRLGGKAAQSAALIGIPQVVTE